MTDICVGVSGMNAADNPGPGVGVARSLKEDSGLSIKIVGLAYDAMEPGIYIDWLIDKSIICLKLPLRRGRFSLMRSNTTMVSFRE